MNNYIFPFLWMRDQEEDVLRNEIAKIEECGIRAVCLESRPHPDFGGPGWWHDFDIVLDEAKKRDLKIWVLDDAHFPTGQANGKIPEEHPELARKYLMMQHTDCVGSIVQASLDVNLFMTKAFTWMDFGKPVNKPLIDRQELVSVMAYPVIEGDILGTDPIDLTDCVGEDGWMTADLPPGVWRICVSFITYDFGARNEYINYIDEKSVRVLLDAIYEPHYEHYKEEFGKTIAGFFSDEPGFYNVDDFDMNDAIGRKKMALPWSDEMYRVMEEKAGADWKQQLPLLWMDSEDQTISAAARKEYMDHASELYSKNFSRQLGKWCEDHHVEYIGHVIEDNNEHCRLGCGAGHYFRAMDGQHMAGIDTIGGQILPGNPYASRHGVAYVGDGKFNHFGLAKLGASSAQIDPKKKGRLMCEAFGAYGWNFGVRSMKWLVDYLLIQGVNHFVPHAFSMAEYPDCDCPPHFYARGNNPEFTYFAELMKYTNRMCECFNDGENVPVAGVFYPAEHDWMHDCMQIQIPGQILQEIQIDYELLPLDVLTDPGTYGTKIEDGRLIVNGRKMQILLIPETDYLDEKLAKFLKKAVKKGLKAAYINHRPVKVVGEQAEQEITVRVPELPVIPLEQIAEELKKQKMYDILVSEEEKSLLYYHYRKEEDIYFLFNTSLSETIETEVLIPEQTELICWDAWKDTYVTVEQKDIPEGRKVAVKLKPYESLILMTNHSGREVQSQEVLPETCDVMDLSNGWNFSKGRSAEYPDFSKPVYVEKLRPVSAKEPQFSGIMRYEKKVEVTQEEKRILLSAQYVYEAAEVFVNGKTAGKRLTPGYEWDITELCVPGENEIVIEVVNTPTRDTMKNPGIFGPDREILEPSGMFGKIVLSFY